MVVFFGMPLIMPVFSGRNVFWKILWISDSGVKYQHPQNGRCRNIQNSIDILTWRR